MELLQASWRRALEKQSPCKVRASMSQLTIGLGAADGVIMANLHAGDGKRFTKGAYCLGKVVWGKGWEELIKLLAHCKKTDSPCPATHIDAFGDGEARVTVRPAQHHKDEGLGLCRA